MVNLMLLFAPAHSCTIEGLVAILRCRLGLDLCLVKLCVRRDNSCQVLDGFLVQLLLVVLIDVLSLFKSSDSGNSVRTCSNLPPEENLLLLS